MSTDTLADAVAGMSDLTTLTMLLELAGLIDLLCEPGPYTLFAPTDAAFARLPPPVLDALRANRPRLEGVLGDHIIPGALVAADLMDLATLIALSGGKLTLSWLHGLRVEQSYLIAADHRAANGVLHRINVVLRETTLSD